MPNHNPKPLLGFTAQDIERFYRFVPFGLPPDVCWAWKGGCNARRYGVFWLKGRLGAHRVSYLLSTGQDPGDLLVCHRCDNPPCVNPAHLFLGTIRDNSEDRDHKGRNVAHRGARVGTSKLSDEQVREIRNHYAAGASMDMLGDKYGVHSTTIWYIVRRKTWAHL